MEGHQYPTIPGVKFVPDEQHLILHYLTNKIRGEPLAWDGIKDFDVYGEYGPWEILNSDGGTIYFFATSKMKNASMKQRTCAFGTWKLQQNKQRVEHGGCEIGSRAYLSFYPDEKNVDPLTLNGNWNMYEYSLPCSENQECPVICKLSFKAWTEKEKARRALQMQEDSSESDTSTYRSKKRAKVHRRNWQPSSSCSNGDQENSNDANQYFNRNIVEELGFDSSIQGAPAVQGYSEPCLGGADVNAEPSMSGTTSEHLIQEAGIEWVEPVDEDLFFDASVLDYITDANVSLIGNKDGDTTTTGYDPFCSNAFVEPCSASDLSNDEPQPPLEATLSDMMIQTGGGWGADSLEALEKFLDDAFVEPCSASDLSNNEPQLPLEATLSDMMIQTGGGWGADSLEALEKFLDSD